MKNMTVILLAFIAVLNSANANVPSTGSYSVVSECTGNLGENLIVGGDFGSGTTPILPSFPNIITEFEYIPTLAGADGSFCVANTTANAFTDPVNLWINTQDASSDPNGYMLVVDSWYVPFKIYETTVSGLCENSVYQFSVDIINLLGSEHTWATDAIVNFFINDEQVYTTLSIDKDESWHTFTFNYIVPEGVSEIVYHMETAVPGGHTGDFAMDNIKVQQCFPYTELSIDGPDVICEGNDLVLTADLEVYGYATPYFQWLIWNDLINDWDILEGQQSDTLTINNASLNQSGTYHCVVSNSPNNINNSACWVSEAIQTVIVEAPPAETFINAAICEDEVYILGNQELTSAGDYSHTFTTAIGCDSVVSVNLEILAPQTSETNISICANESYNFNGISYNNTGSYEAIFPDINGCDSLAMLNLTVLPLGEADIAATICDGENYQIGGVSYNQSGFYTETVTAINGCDSIINLELVVESTYSTSLTEIICERESYQLGTELYTESGFYTANLQSIHGCDSIVQLELIVLPIIEVDLTSTLCEGESFPLGTNNYATSGQYEATFTAVNGCDSIVTLDLTILEPQSTSIEEYLCAGSVYETDQNTYTTSGNYTENYTSNSGCDSIVNYNITIEAFISTNLNASICADDVYVFGTSTLNESGLYTEVFQNINGCDSTVYLTLEVLPNFNTYVDASICNGDFYNFGDDNYFTSGTYIQYYPASNGCDSLVHLNLVVEPSYESSYSEIICEGESVTIGNQVFDTNGEHTAILQTTNGCDSIINVSLSVIPDASNIIEYELCEGEMLLNGIAPLTDTLIVELLQNQFGCDSLIETNVTVYPLSETVQEISLCEGDVFEQTQFNTDTMLVDYLTNIWGCDSTVFTNIIVNPTYETSDTIIVDIDGENRGEITKNDIIGGDLFRSESDTITLVDTLLTVNGCDSIIGLVYIYLYPTETHLNVTLCEGNEYLGVAYTEPTTLIETLETTIGTDSIVYTHINVLYSFTDTLYQEICHGESHIVNGQTETESGFYTELFFTTSGCDSTWVTELVVLDDLSTNETIEICAGENVVIHQETEIVSGIYTATFTDQNGCDSTSTVQLIVHPTYETELATSICAGDLYEGLSIQNDTIINETWTSTNGCDSLVSTFIEILQPSDTTLYVTLPYGGMYEGITYLEDTTLNDITNAANTCDSTITTIITVIQAVETNLEYTLCEGEQLNGIAYYQDTVFTQNLQTVNGFDSLVTTNIYINFPQTTYLDDVSCTFPTGTVQEIIYVDQNGCDSTVITVFENIASENDTLEISLCAGEMYAGVTYTETTNFEEITPNQFGCDSTTYFNITVLPTPQVELSGIDQFCATESITIELDGLETVIWTEQADTLIDNTINEGGFYYIQATNANGCSTLDTIWVPNPTNIEAELSYNPAPCDQPTTASIQIDTVYGGEAPYLYSLNDGMYQQNPYFGGLGTGAFEINIQDANGCEFYQIMVIEEPPASIEVSLGETQQITWGDSIQLNPTVDNPNLIDEIIWSPAEGLSCYDCLTPMATPDNSVTYTVTVITENGCDDSAEITLYVDKERNLYIPNVFTPDGDGINDVFTVYPGQGVEQVQLMQVYDRWGNHVFERTDFDPLDIELGWNGYFRSQKMNPGVYVYYIEVLYEDGVIIPYKGDVTIL